MAYNPLLLSSPEVIASYGTPAVDVDRVEVSPAVRARHEGRYESQFLLNPSPRELTSDEASVYLPSFVERFAMEHPEIRVTYAEIRRGSPQLCLVQYTTFERTPLPPLAVVATWIMTALIITAVVVLVGVFVAPALKVVYEIVTKPVPAPIMWLIYLIPIAVAGFIAYKILVKPKPPPK